MLAGSSVHQSPSHDSTQLENSIRFSALYTFNCTRFVFIQGVQA